MDEGLRTRLQKMTRQSLHATKLSLVHPITGEDVSWEAPMPKSMQTVVDALADELKNENDNDEVTSIAKKVKQAFEGEVYFYKINRAVA